MLLKFEFRTLYDVSQRFGIPPSQRNAPIVLRGPMLNSTLKILLDTRKRVSFVHVERRLDFGRSTAFHIHFCYPVSARLLVDVASVSLLEFW